MSLRKNTLLTVGAAYIGLIAVLFVSARLLLLDGFVGLEQRTVVRDLDRAMSAVDEELQGLWSTALDWSAWDETYQFVQDRNPKYIEDNLAPSTFAALRLDAMVFVDAAGQIAYAGAYDSESREIDPAPDSQGAWAARQSVSAEGRK